MLSVPAALTRLPPGTRILGQHPTERKKKGGGKRLQLIVNNDYQALGE